MASLLDGRQSLTPPWSLPQAIKSCAPSQLGRRTWGCSLYPGTPAFTPMSRVPVEEML